jgi:arginase
MVVRKITFIGAPTSAGAFSVGQEEAPAALREAGLLGSLASAGADVEDGGDLPLVRWRPDRASPRAQNVDDVVASALRVREAVAAALAQDRFALVVGGDCTTGVGTIAGAGSGREAAVIYFDLHADLNTTSSVAAGALDWTGMAHALGLEDTVPALRDVGSTSPLLRPDQVVLFAHGWQEATAWERATIERLPLARVSVEEVAEDPRAAAARARSLAEGFTRLVVHFDVDVVDFTDAPLSENTGRGSGLTLRTALEALGALLSSAKVVAMTVTELNPTHAAADPGSLHRLVAGLTEAVAA